MRYRPNKFRAKPESYAGETMGGVHSHPGFHTTGTMEIAACYAQAKTVSHPWTLFPRADKPLPDYPVIVTLDMDGLVPVADYDAERQIWPKVRDVLLEFFRMNPDADRRTLETWLEADGIEEREPMGRGYPSGSALFTIASWRVENPYGALRDFIDGCPCKDVMALLRSLVESDSKPPDEVLCALADQYRYVEDVAEGRVASVHYMKPFWPELLDYQADEWDEGEPAPKETDAELAEKLEALGWSVLDVEDVYNETARVVTTGVYSSRKRPKRPEYHGTTYRNLLSAAPRLGKKLPVPPPPYRGAT